MKKRTIIGISMAFFIPAILMLITYIIQGIHPFGNKSLLTVDMNGQYISFYSYFREIILNSNFDFFYTFSKTMGGDMLGLSAYYLFSPFNFIFLLFKTADLMDAVMIITLLKIGCCGITMHLYLRRKNASFSSLIFSTAYACMTYNIVYQQNLMWIDCVILLPLVIWGIESLVQKKKFLLYSLSLLAAIFTNYYIGFMICIFSLLYYLYYTFLIHQGGLKQKLKTIPIFVIVSLLTAGISAFILLPTLRSLSGGKASFDLSQLTMIPNFSPIDFVSKLFCQSFDFEQLSTGLPNLFCGCFILITGFLYFVSEKISLMHKIGGGILLGILAISTYLNGLNLIWHGFNMPTWFPYRYSFLFSFLLILLGYLGYTHLPKKHIHIKYSLFIVITVILSWFVYKKQYSFMSEEKILLTLILLIVGLLLLYFMSSMRKQTKKLVMLTTILIFALQVTDLTLNTNYILSKIEYKDYQKFYDYIVSTEPVIQSVKDADTDFYRMEKTFIDGQKKNDPMLFAMHGLSHYSSSEKNAVKDFMYKLGFRNNGNWASYGRGASISSDSFMSVKYVLSKNKMPDAYQLLDTIGDISVYKNPYALPFGFVVSPQSENAIFNDENIFELQNQLWSTLSAQSESTIFKPEQVKSVKLNNLKAEPYQGGIHYTKVNPSKKASITYNVNISSDFPHYAYFPTSSMSKVNTFLNKKSLGKYFDIYQYDMINLGDMKKSDKSSFQFRISLLENEVDIKQPLFYFQDLTELAENYNVLAQNGYQIEQYSSSHFKGKINSTKNGLLMFTMPYELGWKFKVDGKRVMPVQGAQPFISIPIMKGSHQVELTYVPSGFNTGLLISVISLTLWLGIVFLYYGRRNIDKHENRGIFIFTK